MSSSPSTWCKAQTHAMGCEDALLQASSRLGRSWCAAASADTPAARGEMGIATWSLAGGTHAALTPAHQPKGRSYPSFRAQSSSVGQCIGASGEHGVSNFSPRTRVQRKTCLWAYGLLCRVDAVRKRTTCSNSFRHLVHRQSQRAMDDIEANPAQTSTILVA